MRMVSLFSSAALDKVLYHSAIEFLIRSSLYSFCKSVKAGLTVYLAVGLLYRFILT